MKYLPACYREQQAGSFQALVQGFNAVVGELNMVGGKKSFEMMQFLLQKKGFVMPTVLENNFKLDRSHWRYFLCSADNVDIFIPISPIRGHLAASKIFKIRTLGKIHKSSLVIFV